MSTLLRNCSQVGKQTVKQIIKIAPTLSVLNLSGTAIDADDLVSIAEACLGLEVLKVADNAKLRAPKSKKGWERFVALAADPVGATPDRGESLEFRPLTKLRKLKVRAAVRSKLDSMRCCEADANI